MIHLSISLNSQIGCVRDHNEDIILVDTDTYRDTEATREIDITETGAIALAVADGLGGHNAGEVASEDAARELGNHIAALPRVLSARELRDDIDQWVQNEHDYLIEQGMEDEEKCGMGTTLVGVICYREAFYSLNCGDSRLYLLHEGHLQQISQDHALYQYTHRACDRHVITNCLGAGVDSYADFDDITSIIGNGDKLLLCSDGLTDMVPDDKLEILLNNDATAPDLVAAAYSAGGVDNVSVIVATITFT